MWANHSDYTTGKPRLLRKFLRLRRCTNLRKTCGFFSFLINPSIIAFYSLVDENLCKSRGYKLGCISGTKNARSYTGIVMGKNIERFGAFEIRWISVPEIPGCANGVEFHYRAGDHRKQLSNGRDDGKMIGFIDGLGWLDKDGRPVKVYFLSTDSKEWGRLSSRAGKILNGLKECVFTVLEEKINPDQIWHEEIIKANIFTRWNCWSGEKGAAGNPNPTGRLTNRHDQ
jgi:hypothetical protein